MKLLVIIYLFTLSYAITPIEQGKLPKGTSCEKFFLEYKEKQKFFYATGEDEFKLTFNRLGTKMGGMAVVCADEMYSIYLLEKKNELDSEKDFLANWLFDRLEKEDDKIKLNTFEPAKTTQTVVKKQSPLRKKLPFDLPAINQHIFLPYTDIEDEIFIFTFKSPCALCLNTYLTFAQYYKRIKLHIYYASYFKFNNIDILEKESFRKLVVVGDCEKAYHYIKDYYKRSQETLNCVNKKVIDMITGKQVLSNLSFSQISMNNFYDRRLGAIFISLDLF